MKWSKSPPELRARFDAAAPDDERVQRRPMFGFPALFSGGHMFASTYHEQVVVRLGPEGRATALEQGWSLFEPMPGRTMREYVVLPPDVVDDPAALREWIGRAFDYVQALPAKAKSR